MNSHEKNKKKAQELKKHINYILILSLLSQTITLAPPHINYIVDSIEIDLVKFIHAIDLSSYLYTFGFMLLFTIIVSVIVHIALKKIDMIESLKSIE